MKNEQIVKSTVTIKANGKSLIVSDSATGAKVVLTVENGQLVRNMEGCITKHDYQYGGNIAHFVKGLTTLYMSNRIGWADRMKKIEKASAKINAKSIRNMSSKLRVTLKPIFNIPEDQYFAEQCKA